MFRKHTRKNELISRRFELEEPEAINNVEENVDSDLML